MTDFILRESLKTGWLSGIYGLMRRVKRSAKGETLSGTIEPPLPPYSKDSLLSLVDCLSGSGRYHFSLAWDSFDAGQYRETIAHCYTSLFACFESPARAALLIAVAAHRSNLNTISTRFIPYIRPTEMTTRESELFAEIAADWQLLLIDHPKEWDQTESSQYFDNVDELIIAAEQNSGNFALLNVEENGLSRTSNPWLSMGTV